MKNLFLALFIFFSSSAIADSIVYTWDTPTARTDGTALTYEQIDGYVLKYSIDGVEQPLVNIDKLYETVTIPAQEGLYEAQIATIAGGVVGPYSAPITTTVGAINSAQPQYPNNITVTIQCSSSGCTLEIK